MVKNKFILIAYFIMFVICITVTMGGVFQNEISESENRKLATIDQLDSNLSLIDNFNILSKVSSEQFIGREELIKSYANIGIMKNDIVISMIGDKADNILFEYGNHYKLDGEEYIIDKPLEISDQKNQAIENRMWNFERIDDKYGDEIEMYIYRPFSSNEIPDLIYSSWDADQTSYYSDMFDARLGERYTIMNQQVLNYEDYKLKHFKTDHHWNYNGAYQGYSDIITMISKDFDIVEPYPIESESCFDVEFFGSLSLNSNGLYGSESFCDYNLTSPRNFTTTVNGEVKDVGEYEKFIENMESWNEYIYEGYHGLNNQTVQYDSLDEKNDVNLLVIGDSFSNAITDDLALHFNKLYKIDPRQFIDENDQYNTTFSLDDFLSNNDVDAILFLQYYESVFFDSRMYLHIELDK